jgi:hypothetical protein
VAVGLTGEPLLRSPVAVAGVAVTLAALSYAGTLRLTVLSNPSCVPDVGVLTTALPREFGI